MQDSRAAAGRLLAAPGPAARCPAAPASEGQMLQSARMFGARRRARGPAPPRARPTPFWRIPVPSDELDSDPFPDQLPDQFADPDADQIAEQLAHAAPAASAPATPPPTSPTSSPTASSARARVASSAAAAPPELARMPAASQPPSPTASPTALRLQWTTVSPTASRMPPPTAGSPTTSCGSEQMAPTRLGWSPAASPTASPTVALSASPTASPMEDRAQAIPAAVPTMVPRQDGSDGSEQMAPTRRASSTAESGEALPAASPDDFAHALPAEVPTMVPRQGVSDGSEQITPIRIAISIAESGEALPTASPDDFAHALPAAVPTMVPRQGESDGSKQMAPTRLASSIAESGEALPAVWPDAELPDVSLMSAAFSEWRAALSTHSSSTALVPTESPSADSLKSCAGPSTETPPQVLRPSQPIRSPTAVRLHSAASLGLLLLGLPLWGLFSLCVVSGTSLISVPPLAVDFGWSPSFLSFSWHLGSESQAALANPVWHLGSESQAALADPVNKASPPPQDLEHALLTQALGCAEQIFVDPGECTEALRACIDALLSYAEGPAIFMAMPPLAADASCLDAATILHSHVSQRMERLSAPQAPPRKRTRHRRRKG